MFKIYKGGEYFFQWDLGQRLEMTEDFTSVHFCNQTEGCALVCDTYIEDGIRLVNVPNVLLQNTNNIRVYGCYAEGDNVCFAKDYQIFRVIKRGKPEEYVYTEDDVFTYEALEARVEALENGAGLTGEGGVPFVVDGTLTLKQVEAQTMGYEYYELYINVGVDNYTNYNIGDSFLINITNDLNDYFAINAKTIFTNVYIKINDLNAIQLNGYYNNDYKIKGLFYGLNDFIVIYQKQHSNIYNFFLWQGGSVSNDAELTDETITYKRIGFTESCNYIATAEDGLSAFQQAITEANENDIILVEEGVYNGSDTLNIDKDLTFIAVGDAVINFSVKTQGGGDFSFETWEWTSVYEGKHTKWYGFIFNKYFDVGVNANPDNAYYNGFATAKNCVFNGGHCVMVGNFTNCAFNITQLTIGHYYGADDSTFTDCKFSCSIEANVGSDNFKRCDFHFNGSNSVNFSTWKVDNFVNCKMYAPNDILTISDNHGAGELNLNDTVIFAVSVVNGSYGDINGGFLFTPTAIN